MKTILLAVAALLCVGAFETAQANPIDVSYRVSGSPGNWLVDFSVTNNLGGTNYVYFFGTKLPSTDEVGAPPLWAYSPANNPWTYTPSGTVYNNPWCLGGCLGDTNFDLGISPGQTLSGFQALDTDLTQPTSLPWFAYSYTYFGTYDGPGCFGCGGSPGFEGTAHVIPVPAALPLFVTGLGALGMIGWRRRRKAAAAN
jgi:hypothetical protein